MHKVLIETLLRLKQGVLHFEVFKEVWLAQALLEFNQVRTGLEAFLLLPGHDRIYRLPSKLRKMLLHCLREVLPRLASSTP